MNRKLLCIVLVISFLLIQYNTVLAGTPKDVDIPDEWIYKAEGISYQEFHLQNPPNNVFVSRMERNNPYVTIESGIAQGKLYEGRETVRGMTYRYNQSINYWDEKWGNRSNVIVGINGYFFDYTTGIPQRGQVQSGWYAKRFDNYENGSGFVWPLDRAAFIGGCVYHKPAKQFITYIKSGKTQKFYGINGDRGKDDFIIYTHQYASNTHTDNSGVEILVEMTKPNLIFPDLPDNQLIGVVREIRDKKGSTSIPFDHIVLSATGIIRTSILSNITGGDEIGIVQEISHYESDCNTKSSHDWTNAYASVGGSFHFLKNGVIQSFSDPGANSDAPRTAIAFNDNYIYYIVVDGRNPGVSEGMNMSELGKFAKDYLGAIEGINQDGGSSSTMVVNGNVVNNTKCNINPIYYNCSNQEVNSRNNIPIDVFEDRRIEESGIDYLVTDGDIPEYMVANSMMMVVVEPFNQSTSFEPGRFVKVVNSADVRLGPGTNYASIGSISGGMVGEVQEHMNQLNGVYAKNSYWWKVDFGSLTGWVKEEHLTGWFDRGGIKTYLPQILR